MALYFPKSGLNLIKGEYEQCQYLVLEWLEKTNGGKSFWKLFAEGLAQLHNTSHHAFGWYTSNYIGSLVQENNFCDSWSEFYATKRILPSAKRLYDEGSFAATDIAAAEALCKKLEDIYPDDPPALLHGDLWAGNFMSVKTSDSNQVIPAVYDPAVYYGHREMDIGMSLLFGGFDNSFYDYYNEHYPLEKNWRTRISLSQLYPLLIHAILFGGGYVSQCSRILHDYQ